MKIALQLYTLRDLCKKDFLRTLAEVAALGYEGVEFAGFFDVSANELREKLDELNLIALASHTPLVELINNIDSVMDYNRVIGNSNIVCPHTIWDSDEEFYDICKELIKAEKILSANGFTLLYHNHDHEFMKLKDSYYLDEYYKTVDQMKMELDTYWVSVAGLGIISYMRKHKDILELVHVKDLQVTDETNRPSALGLGVLPIESIVNESEELGLQWIIVENDYPGEDSIKDVKISIDYLRKCLL